MAEKFALGRVVITATAHETLDERDVQSALSRHHRGDWGDLSDDDLLENELSLLEGLRLLSSYNDRNGTAFWIITEADRSVTTVILPSDY